MTEVKFDAMTDCLCILMPDGGKFQVQPNLHNGVHIVYVGGQLPWKLDVRPHADNAVSLNPGDR